MPAGSSLDSLSDGPPDPLRSSCSLSNAHQDAAISGVLQLTDTLKQRRKRKPLVHEECFPDQTLDTATRKRMGSKKTIAEKASRSTPHALTPSFPKSSLPNDSHNSCLGMFLSLSWEQKHKLRRSLWNARNMAITCFKNYKYLNIGGEELEWPFQRDEQLVMVRTATRKLFEQDANDAAACPYRRGAAMEYLTAT